MHEIYAKIQGSKGISQLALNWWTQNYLFCQINEPTNKNWIKVPKVVKPTNKKKFLKNFGD